MVKIRCQKCTWLVALEGMGLGGNGLPLPPTSVPSLHSLPLNLTIMVQSDLSCEFNYNRYYVTSISVQPNTSSFGNST